MVEEITGGIIEASESLGGQTKDAITLWNQKDRKFGIKKNPKKGGRPKGSKNRPKHLRPVSKPMEVPCAECGNLFKRHPYASAAKFCSEECRRMNVKVRRTTYVEKAYCEICGKEFERAKFGHKVKTCTSSDCRSDLFSKISSGRKISETHREKLRQNLTIARTKRRKKVN